MSIATHAVALLATLALFPLVPAATQDVAVTGTEGIITNDLPLKPNGDVWKVIVASEGLAAYRSPAGPSMAPGGLLKFGEAYYVMRQQSAPRRYLLGRFGRDAAGLSRFEGYRGWADPRWLLDRGTPMTVDEARTTLRDQAPGDAKFAGRVKSLLPDAAADRYANVTLKAVTHPERGIFCHRQPLAPEAYEQAVAEKVGRSLQTFGFYYVYKVVVEEGNRVYCLLSPKPAFDLYDEKPRSDEELEGWIEIDRVRPWTTREGFEMNMSPKAHNARAADRSPIQLYQSRAHLEAWADPSLRDDKGRVLDFDKKVVDLAWEEDLAAPRREWDPDWMRYPIFDFYDLPNGRRGYQLCILGESRDQGSDVITQEKREEYRRTVHQLTQNMRVVELVIVIDCTGSMSNVFAKVKEALRNLVSNLKSREERKDEIEERIILKVGVVSYWDFPKQRSTKVVDDSKTYFEVGTKEGMRAFEDYMDSLRADEGGDFPEEPFEGLNLALTKYLLPGPGSLHTQSASGIIILFGDAPNHVKGTPGNEATRFDREDIFRQLKVQSQQEGEAPAKGETSSKAAVVTIHSVFTETAGGQGQDWANQMNYLAKESGGTSIAIPFKAGAIDQAAARLGETMEQAIDKRRALLVAQIEEIRRRFAGGAVKGVVARLNDELIRQMVSSEEWERIQKHLSRTFFAMVHAVDRLPSDPTGEPRLQVRVLLTSEETRDLSSACSQMALLLDEEIKKNRFGGADAYWQMVVRAMNVAFGKTDITNEQVVIMAKNATPAEIQKKLNALPIRLRCLDELRPPKNPAEVFALRDKLKKGASDLEDIRIKHPERFFTNGLGGGAYHIWLKDSELP